MLTERFKRLRKQDLNILFEKDTIIRVWREIAKDQLRNFDLKDLYDHYDFNYNIEERAIAIRTDLLNGSYKVAQPLIYRIEKKFGVCRHIIVPQPTDVLILQVLVEYVSTAILAKQPSKNAFYSRDRHRIKSPHQLEDYGLSIRQQWKRLQQLIYNFNDKKELIIVTDISNYYDCISIGELRKVFTSLAEIKEVVIDLLFRILEEISWKPDYLPYSGKGLPTTNIEGVRLLAHTFLFEIDYVIKQKTGDNFTRWMDDIVIGADTRTEAIEIISAVSDMLKSRGLALNLSKTDIYSAQDGNYHFEIDENRYLDTIEKVKSTDANYKKICSQHHSNFKKRFKNQRPKYWDKVTKRYITAYGKLNSKLLLYSLANVYITYPSLRQNLIYYLQKIGYTKKTAEVVLQILKSINVFDDLSLYQLCMLVTQWEIPINSHSREFLHQFEEFLIKLSFLKKEPSYFYCVLWFKAKYSHPDELLRFIEKYKNIWHSDSFLRRQVTAILSRLLVSNNTAVLQLLFNQISSGVTNTVTVANQVYQFSTLGKIDVKLSYYLFPTKSQNPYPLSKFLVLCSVLNSAAIRNNEVIKKRVLATIKDPYYLKWLDSQYNIS